MESTHKTFPDGLGVFFRSRGWKHLFSDVRDRPIQILVITAYVTEQDIYQALKAGAYAFLLKGAAPRQVREAIRRVANGESFLPPDVELKPTESKGYSHLSKRESQVLQCLALGRTNKEIAQVLAIGQGTVKHHAKSILSKLNATGRADAVGIAVRRGLSKVS